MTTIENEVIGRGIYGLPLVVGETPVIGSGVLLEPSRRWVQLLGSDWDKCQFRIPDPVFGIERGIACNIKITGHTLIRKYDCLLKRIRITWVGDGEPDTHSFGWIRVR